MISFTQRLEKNLLKNVILSETKNDGVRKVLTLNALAIAPKLNLGMGGVGKRLFEPK